MVLQAALASALLSTLVLGQQASVSGTVVDPTGAIIAKAKVLLINTRTLNVDRSVTGSDGRFIFSNLLAGEYEVKAGAVSCFKSTSRRLDLKSDLRTEVSLKLRFDPKCKLID